MNQVFSTNPETNESANTGDARSMTLEEQPDGLAVQVGPFVCTPQQLRNAEVVAALVFNKCLGRAYEPATKEQVIEAFARNLKYGEGADCTICICKHCQRCRANGEPTPASHWYYGFGVDKRIRAEFAVEDAAKALAQATPGTVEKAKKALVAAQDTLASAWADELGVDVGVVA